jgi:hypothetical protein
MTIYSKGILDQLAVVNFNTIILAAAGLAAFGALWKMFRSSLRLFAQVDRAVPVLFKLAKEFENNGGSTIKDKIDTLFLSHNELLKNIENDRKELQIADRLAIKIAEDARIVADTNAAIVNELSATSTADILHIKEYMHENMHVIRNQMQEQNYYQQAMQSQMTQFRKDLMDKDARLEARLDSMFPLINRRRESDIRDSSPNE